MHAHVCNSCDHKWPCKGLPGASDSCYQAAKLGVKINPCPECFSPDTTFKDGADILDQFREVFGSEFMAGMP